MGTELVDPSTLNYDELAKKFGQGNVGGDFLPRLSINGKFEDEQDPPNKLPAGSFFVSVKNDKDEVLEYFSPRKGPVYFRPYFNTYRYEKYDSDKDKVVSRSIIVKDWNSDILDDVGGVRCGKLSKDQLKEADKEKVEQSKMVNCYRILYGEVRMPKATNRNGDEVVLEWTPCVLRMRGTNFMPFGDIVRDLDALKKLMLQQEFELTLTKHVKGDTTWYIIGFEYDPVKALDITQDVMNLANVFDKRITDENKTIMDAHHKALKLKSSNKVDKELSGELDKDFDDASDLDDEIPF